MARAGSLRWCGLMLAALVVSQTLIKWQEVVAEEGDSSKKKVFKKLVSASGQVPVDQETGKPLPEELDDGELEGGDQLSGWSYTDQRSWSQEYPICQGKQMRQSPIDIITDKVVLKPYARLEFIDYDQKIKFQLKNTHHSVSVMPIAKLAPTVRASWVPGEHDFELQEIHFHWGDGQNKGSEHEINDAKAAAEMHMVHYKRGLKKEDIGRVENSVLVVGVLIESDEVEHNKLESLVAKASMVNGTDSEYTSNNAANLINLLPDHRQSFYFYNGSLTTPPCYETVTWVIMSEPIYMSNSRLIELANLEANTFAGRHKISSNHRDIQPLLERSVYVSFNTSESVTPKRRKLFADASMFKVNLQASWSKLSNIRRRVLERFRVMMGLSKKQSVPVPAPTPVPVPTGPYPGVQVPAPSSLRPIFAGQ